ncbi:unnamed protein product [Linum trigynum]|uniref:Uncharacterized protein n=1 Tax=Linum trigynum TaxID=586398 RepID=A0AAV2FY01_9ROSI
MCFLWVPGTQVHFFGECRWTCRLWRSTSFARYFEKHAGRSCIEWVTGVFKTAGDEECEEWSVLMWYLWKERNAHCFNGSKMEETIIVSHASCFLHEYKDHQQRGESIHQDNLQVKWQQPRLGWVKVNTDAGVLQGGGAGLGVVARDDT